MRSTVNTVLGPVPADALGVTAVHEALLSVVPGAQYAFDITIDRAEVFETLAAWLTAFKIAGGGTVVDSTGMFHGRDVRLYENLSRATGVHIIASTGMGPEENLGGYFLTPQTNPPTPWPAERFAELFAAEVTEGMVVPRVERRAGAGLVVTTATEAGMTPTDESLLRGAARAAAQTGVGVSLGYGADPVAALELALSEGIPAARVVIRHVDAAPEAARAVVERGAFASIDGFGGGDVADAERVALVGELVAAGHGSRVLVSAGSVGVAVGAAPVATPLSALLTEIAPALRAAGVADADIDQILIINPRTLLAGEEH